MTDTTRQPRLSQDAAIVLALAETAIPFASSIRDEAERWVRILRMHGQVGEALQALGVGEAPLASMSQPRAVRLLRRRSAGEDIVELAADRAIQLACNRHAACVSTVDVLFAIFDLYGPAFDRALYSRGATREELVERLAVGESVAAER